MSEAILQVEDDDQDEWRWKQMEANGFNEHEIEQAKQRKRWKEEIVLHKYIIKYEVFNHDISLSAVDSYLQLATALDGLQNRYEALNVLKQGYNNQPSGSFSPKIALAYAKLLFRDDQHENATSVCRDIIDTLKSTDQDSNYVIDAYYLLGWVHIHDDNHTNAYLVWSEGYGAVPASEVLKKQAFKRLCWDKHFDTLTMTSAYSLPNILHSDSDDSRLQLVGSAVHDSFSLDDDIDCWSGINVIKSECTTYSVDRLTSPSHGELRSELCSNLEYDQVTLPPYALFDRSQQQRGIIFRSRYQLLTEEECSNVIKIVYSYHAKYRGERWDTVRHSSVKTTDVAVEDIPELRDWLRVLLHTRIYPMLSFLFPTLADGTHTCDEQHNLQIDLRDSLTDNRRNYVFNESSEHHDSKGIQRSRHSSSVGKSRFRVHDAFIVRYDADLDMSLSLPEHVDTSCVSVIVSLNSECRGDYCGGGTWFEALDSTVKVVNAEIGRAVAFAGPLKHAGYPITKGTRHILVLFLYVEGFHYGPMLKAAVARCNRRNGIDSSNSSPIKKQMYSANKSNDFNACDNNKNASPHSATHSSEPVNNSEEQLLSSGGKRGGFVVYRQTVDLVNMLES